MFGIQTIIQNDQAWQSQILNYFNADAKHVKTMRKDALVNKVAIAALIVVAAAAVAGVFMTGITGLVGAALVALYAGYEVHMRYLRPRMKLLSAIDLMNGGKYSEARKSLKGYYGPRPAYMRNQCVESYKLQSRLEFASYVKERLAHPESRPFANDSFVNSLFVDRVDEKGERESFLRTDGDHTAIDSLTAMQKGDFLEWMGLKWVPAHTFLEQEVKGRWRLPHAIYDGALVASGYSQTE